MNNIPSCLLVSCIVILSLLTNGCTSVSRPANFYLLMPTVDKSNNSLSDKSWIIGVGPIQLADHLQRKQIVSRSNNNKLQIEEFERWAGELDDNISYVITENLNTLINTRAILSYPWTDTINLDYQIEVNITFFTVDENNNVKLIASWSIIDTNSDKLFYVARSEIIIPVTGKTIADQIDAQNKALLKLSETIAVAFQQDAVHKL